MPYGTKEYFIDGSLIRSNGSTLHRSIYLSRQLELRKRGLLLKSASFLYSLQAFLNSNALSFLQKIKKQRPYEKSPI